ncbi:PHD finger protein ING1 isoform X1 [Silene latifolia]|uniref:PHD finger protein ING1 isoform X1 n=1 Tax=Silene latifolia TaxID=37657 RepID=UPI003D77AFCE
MSSFLDEFQANLELLPNILQKKYALLRDLDKSLLEILRQNEQRCEQEIEYLKQRLQSGTVTADPSRLRFSDEAVDEQKHSIRIADEKVALAVQAYDLVDAHIQQLDQYLKKSEEEIRREKELAAASGSSDAKDESGAKSGKGGEGGGRGRKKTRLGAASAAAAAAPVNPTSMDLDLPVDPNEPTYCVCNQVSYGEMVGCDNNECRIEWFHFGCVGVKEKPKGKWYCPDCSVKQKRRKGK